MSANDRQVAGTHYKALKVEPCEKELLNEWLRYGPEGLLYWKKTASSRATAGSKAGWLDKDGYKIVTVRGKKIRAARAVWVMHYGAIPPELQIDHINHDVTDDRLENLRLATISQNCCNRRLQSNSTTGHKGCVFTKGKYQAQIQVGRKYIYLGRFNTLTEATSAYSAASEKFHGEFSHVG